MTCRECGNTTYLTKAGRYYRHRMPPRVFGYSLPLRAGPVCASSGCLPPEAGQ